MWILIKRIISIALALCLCFTILLAMANKADATDPISTMISYARDRLGKTGAELGYDHPWCAHFVYDCAAYAGQTEAIPKNLNAHWLYFDVLKAGGYEVMSPQAGDLVFYNCRICDTTNDGLSIMHVGLVENENYTIEGNRSDMVNEKVEMIHLRMRTTTLSMIKYMLDQHIMAEQSPLRSQP